VLSQREPRDAAVNFVDNGTFMYPKHSNLVDADASETKASTKHLESRLDVIQGHAFWDH